MHSDLAAVWATSTDALADEIISPQQRAYLRLTRLRAIVEDTALLSVPDAFTRDMIESRLRPAITDALSRRLGRPIQVAVTVRPPEEAARDALTAPTMALSTIAPPDTDYAGRPNGGYGSHSPHVPSSREPEFDVPRPESGPGRYVTEPAGRPTSGAATGHAMVIPGGDRRATAGDGGNRLNPKYTFETFVIGSSNRFAHAAAVAVAESPAKAYNPLFVYGGSGLGKTHLLHAIGHYATSLGNARSVRYVSTEEFTNDFINSLRDDKTSAFQRRYRDVDILLIDDIQFLETRERNQEE